MHKKDNLWEVCLKCDAECCKSEIVKTIFVTPREKELLPKINKRFPCAYLNKQNLCSVHNIRPLDCRMHPFDIISENGKYYWVIWDNYDLCPLIKKEYEKFENYLQDIEKNIIPDLKKYIKECDDWMDDEYRKKYEYKIIREIRV